MKPVRTANSDMVYKGSPAVRDLHCQRIAPGVIRSVWYLTPDERAAVAAGANIALEVHREPIPPVGLQVLDEPGVGEDAPLVLERLASLIARDTGPDTPGR